MEDVIFLVLTFLSLINANIKCGNKFFTDYMDLENTSNVKGIFVWMIIFRHSTGYYYRNPNKASIIIDNSLQQNIVSLFLFYSGYGIYKSFSKKGINYIKTLPIKSIILFIKTQLILLLFLLTNKILHKKITLKDYFYAAILKKSIGNSYWFASAIILLYIEAFFSFILIRNKKFNFIGIIFVSILCYFHVKYAHKYYYPKDPVYNLDTIMCFIPGLYYCFFQSYIDKIIMFNDIIYLGLISIVTYFYYKYHLHPKEGLLLYRSIKNCIFCIIAVLLTVKIQLKNDFLKFLNSHSYSIYLLQRMVFIYFRQKGILKNNSFIRFFYQFSLILLISSIFDRITIYIDILFKKSTNTNRKHINKKNDIIKMIELS